MKFARIEMLFLIYRDGCALELNTGAADKPYNEKEHFHDTHN